MMPPRIIKHYYDFYKSMNRYGLDLNAVRKSTSKELLLWYQFHRHLTNDYARILPVQDMSRSDLLDLKDMFDVQIEFKAS